MGRLKVSALLVCILSGSAVANSLPGFQVRPTPPVRPTPTPVPVPVLPPPIPLPPLGPGPLLPPPGPPPVGPPPGPPSGAIGAVFALVDEDDEERRDLFDAIRRAHGSDGVQNYLRDFRRVWPVLARTPTVVHIVTAYRTPTEPSIAHKAVRHIALTVARSVATQLGTDLARLRNGGWPPGVSRERALSVIAAHERWLDTTARQARDDARSGRYQSDTVANDSAAPRVEINIGTSGSAHRTEITLREGPAMRQLRQIERSGWGGF